MNRGQIVSRIRLRIKDLTEDNVPDEFIHELITEAQRIMSAESLMLEGKDASLTFNTANDGFALPSDFLKVNYVEWVSSNNAIQKIEGTSISYVRKKRNEWQDLSDESAQEVVPRMYAIINNSGTYYMVLDSETQSSPVLYYYKYDDALSNDSDSPSFPAEFHYLMSEYGVWQITGDNNAREAWYNGLRKMKGKRQKGEPMRMRYQGL